LPKTTLFNRVTTLDWHLLPTDNQPMPLRLTTWLVLLLALIGASSSSPSWADVLTGKIVELADGDTVTVLDERKQQHKIRLAGIDAPERKQPYADASRKHLASLVFGKNVEVRFHKKDRYGRLVGTVFLDGSDVNLRQVNAGLAWHYKAYEREQSEQERLDYSEAEETAHRLRLGLWQEPHPVPPWDFRRARKLR